MGIRIPAAHTAQLPDLFSVDGALGVKGARVVSQKEHGVETSQGWEWPELKFRESELSQFHQTLLDGLEGVGSGLALASRWRKQR